MKKLLLLTSVGIAFAEQPIIVVGSKFEETPNYETPIDFESKPFVDDVFDSISGVNVVNTGQIGAQTSVFTRGTNSNQTGLLVDGVKVSNARLAPFANGSFLNGGLNFKGQNFSFSKGPQSSVIGADAIGGAIAIGSQKGEEGAPSLSLATEYGSFDTTISETNIQGGENALSYNFGANYTSTENDGDNIGFDGLTAFGRLDYTHDLFSITLRGRVLENDAEFLQFGSPAELNTESSISSIQVNLTLTDFLKTSLSYSIFNFDTDAAQGSSNSITKNQVNTLRLTQEVDSGNGVKFLLGGEWENIDEVLSTGSGFLAAEENYAIFGELSYSNDFGTELHLSGRVDYFEELDNSPITGKLSLNQKVNENLQISGSIGTGFRRPSFVDQIGFNSPFFSTPPNLNIDPEESLGGDIGVKVNFFENTSLSVAYFRNELDNLINFNPVDFSAENVDEAMTQGVEVDFRSQVTDLFSVQLAYTYLDTNDDNGDRLLRRPGHTVSLNAVLSDRERYNLGFGIRSVSNGIDVGPIDAEDFIVARLFGSYKFNDQLTLTGRLENLFDEEYQEADGFDSAGFGAFIGAQLTF